MPANTSTHDDTTDRDRARRILITAGPTHEPIDDVRYLANRSSGRLGIETARAAAQQGDAVTLLLGPGPDEPADTRITTHRFRTSADLLILLEEHFPRCDALIMSAAVADYRPVVGDDSSMPAKIPRGKENLTLQLEPTPDLVAQCAASRTPEQIIVAFALEPADTLEHGARKKLIRKGVDAVIANTLASMESSTISDARFITNEGDLTLDPELEKTDFASWLIDAVDARLDEGVWSLLASPPMHRTNANRPNPDQP